MDYETLKAAWDKLERGDPLTDLELKHLKKSAEQGLAYLEARGERFVLFKTRLDLETIKGYMRERSRR